MTTKIKSGLIADNAIVSAHISSGAISSAHLSSIDTDNVSEGSSNLYFTTARARTSFSVTDSGGDGSLAYDNSTGVITYTGPSASEVRAHLSAGTGVTYSSGEFSIGQSVATTASPTFADINITGDLNLTGDINSYSVTDLDIVDQTITLGVGQSESASDGSGIVIAGSSASILWDEPNDEFDFNKSINVTGNIGVSGTVDGVDIAARDAVLTSTTTTAGAALPKAGGTMTGSIISNSNIKTTGRIEIASAQPRILLDRADGSYSWNIYNGDGTGNFPTSTFNIANNAGTAVITALDSGNIGIGTSSPSTNLEVSANGTCNLRLTDSSSPTTFAQLVSANGVLQLKADSGNAQANSSMQFHVDTSERMRIDSNGNVGIGTSSPSTPAGNKSLHIAGTTGAELILERDDSGVAADDFIGGLAFLNLDASNTPPHYLGITARAFNEFGASQLEFFSSFEQYPSGAPDMVLDGSGRVGINDTSPSQKLSVSGTSSVVPARFTAAGNTNTLEVFGNSATDTSTGLLVSAGTSANDYAAYFRKVDGTTPIMMLEGTGNVGIGTSSPLAELNVDGRIVIDDGARANPTGGPSVVIDYQTTSDVQGRIRSRDWDGATWKNFTIEADDIKLLPAGNVGIGTDSPSSEFHVKGDANTIARVEPNNNTGKATLLLSSAGSGDGGIQYDSNSNLMHLFSYNYMTFNVGTGNISGNYPTNERMRIDSNGNVGIGDSATSPSSKLEINTGSIKVVNSGTDAYFFEGVRSGGNVTLRMYDNGNNLYIDSYSNMTFRANQTGGGSGGQIYFGGGDVNIGSSNDSARFLIFDKTTTGQNGIIFRNAAANKGKILLDSSEFMQFYINNSTNAMTIRETKGQIDAAAAGGRFSGYVQDMIHIGADKSEVVRYGNSGKTYADGGSSNYAGYVYGQENFLPGVFMPYSPNQVYRLSASIYQLTNGTGYDHSRHYIGVAGYDENFSFLSVDAIGTYQYNMASNTSLSAGNALEVDVTLKGWQGSGGSNGNKMDEGTVYIRPLILFNYQRSGGTAVLTGFTMMPAGTISDNDSNAGTNY